MAKQKQSSGNNSPFQRFVYRQGAKQLRGEGYDPSLTPPAEVRDVGRQALKGEAKWTGVGVATAAVIGIGIAGMAQHEGHNVEQKWDPSKQVTERNYINNDHQEPSVILPTPGVIPNPAETTNSVNVTPTNGSSK